MIEVITESNQFFSKTLEVQKDKLVTHDSEINTSLTNLVINKLQNKF